jgi:parallel beta-helix repeat protein
VGTGGTVGVDAITLPTFQRPEVELSAGNTQVVLSGASNSIIGFALRQGYILLSGTGCLARNNLVGMTAIGSSADDSPTYFGIIFTGSNATVRNNFVTVNNSGIRTDSGGTGALITLNEVARPSTGHSLTYDGILMVGSVSNIQVTANLTRDQLGGGIEIGFGNNAPASSITVSNNTVQNNGFASGGGASTEPVGFVGYNYAGSNVVVSRNRFVGNAGAGVLLTAASGTLITQNSFSNNGGLSIDLDPRGLDPNSMGTLQGVTLNDSGDADGGPNGLKNYAVITSATIIGSSLTLTGYARPGDAIELYIAQADPTGFGEGLTYLGTLIEGSAADLSAGTGTYGPGNINGNAQGTDTTNQFTFRVAVPSGVALGSRLTSTASFAAETSEFGGNVVVTGGPSLTFLKSVQVFSDPVNGTTNPKSIPGSAQTYTLRVTNQGGGTLDNNSVSVTDAIAANTKLFVGNVGGPGSGPIAFTNGSPSSGLSWTFTALNNATDDLEFSNDGGVTWGYSPAADAEGCDSTVTHIRLSPKGTMPGNGSGDPYFELRFRVVVR